MKISGIGLWSAVERDMGIFGINLLYLFTYLYNYLYISYLHSFQKILLSHFGLFLFIFQPLDVGKYI